MSLFKYVRTIHVYETDLMGIVHHSNYLRFCEEARVAWFRANGYKLLTSEDVFGLVVVETRVRHHLPIRFDVVLAIELQMQARGARLTVQYRLHQGEELFAVAESVHCRVDQNFKVQRLAPKMLEMIRKEEWIETWL